MMRDPLLLDLTFQNSVQGPGPEIPQVMVGAAPPVVKGLLSAAIILVAPQADQLLREPVS